MISFYGPKEKAIKGRTFQTHLPVKYLENEFWPPIEVRVNIRNECMLQDTIVIGNDISEI